MTRVNTIPPEVMFDEWVGAHLREGLRPINKLREGKFRNLPINGPYRLNKGHELWCAHHCLFLAQIWLDYKREWKSRGFNGYDYGPDMNGVPTEYVKDYTPTKADHRHNLSRLCERFRKRKKPYHFKGKVVDNNTDFLLWLYEVKELLGLNK